MASALRLVPCRAPIAPREEAGFAGRLKSALRWTRPTQVFSVVLPKEARRRADLIAAAKEDRWRSGLLRTDALRFGRELKTEAFREARSILTLRIDDACAQLRWEEKEDRNPHPEPRPADEPAMVRRPPRQGAGR
jgi:hypothetical protein